MQTPNVLADKEYGLDNLNADYQEAIDTAVIHEAASESAPVKPRVKILMVDDQQANLLVLEAVLEGLGYELVKARSGEEALKCLLQDDFAVILLDVFMPGMDGFETAQFIRQRKRCRYTPIIFLTALGTTDTQITRGYSVGAVDYLFKPIVPEILRAKVIAFVDLFIKTAMVAQQAEQLRLLEEQRHQAQLAEAQRQFEAEKLQQDMRSAHKVQQLLFPQKALLHPSFDIAGSSFPAAAAGGDYFDYFYSHYDNIDVVIGDVSGHGLGAALLMCSTRAYLRALALAHQGGIDEVLALANRALAADMESDHYVTLLYARLNPSAMTLSYTSAGHFPGYVIDRHGTVKFIMHSTSVPLGVIADGEFPAGDTVDLESGDLIFLFTDGVIEAESPDGTFFETTRALDIVREYRWLPANEIVKRLRECVTDFAQQPTLKDDLTAVVVKVR